MNEDAFVTKLGYATGLALHHLSVRPLTIYELADVMGISHSGAAKHVRVLVYRGLVVIQDLRKTGGMGRRAPAYASKVPHAKPEEDRCGHNGIDKSRYAEMKAVLLGQRLTADEIAEDLQVSVASIKTRLRYWRTGEHMGQHFRICSWAKAETERVVMIPVYTFGAGQDVPKPKPLGNHEAVKRYKEKRRAILNSRQVARRRSDGAAISPFSQLLVTTGARAHVLLDEVSA